MKSLKTILLGTTLAAEWAYSSEQQVRMQIVYIQ
jgi:hypothetical protein